MDKARVKAELFYNPYLMETTIKFNGREPRINSRVEKFYHSNLQDWVNDIPEIFSEEMNGYDFELEFTGTVLDCNEVRNAFKRAGVSEESVPISHKKELGERTDKIRLVKALLNWLKDNPNSHFDYEHFHEKNEELLDETCSLYVLQGGNIGLPALKWEGVSVECLSKTDELDNTELNHVPIVVVIGDDNIIQLQSITEFLIIRNDIVDNQVFFIIDSKLNLDIAKRTLIDLGFDEPQIVEALDSPLIKKYFELYPHTDYICKVIKELEKEVASIEKDLSEEKEIKEEANSDTHKEIEKLEGIIIRLKEADNQIINRNKIGSPSEFSQAKIEFYSKILNWRKKKTKITSDSEANKLSVELSKEVSFAYNDFSKAIAISEDECISGIKGKVNEMYLNAEYDQVFIPNDVDPEKFDILHTPRIENELMQIKEYSPVMRKEQGLFFMPKNSDEDIEIEMETTYYVQKWREYALGVVGQMADSLIQTRIEAIQNYDERLATAYHEHLTDLIGKFENEKETIGQHLSSEERQLQVDKEWLEDFKRQLNEIERR